MALHKKKFLVLTAGVVTLAVFAGILVMLIDINHKALGTRERH